MKKILFTIIISIVFSIVMTASVYASTGKTNYPNVNFRAEATTDSESFKFIWIKSSDRSEAFIMSVLKYLCLIIVYEIKSIVRFFQGFIQSCNMLIKS